MKLLILIMMWCQVESVLMAQAEISKPGFTRIWHRGNGAVGVTFDGIIPHEPAFIGEDSSRVRLQLLNKGKESIFLKGFDLSATENDRALLHDVFEGPQCRQALNSSKGKRNDNPGGALGIGYSRLHTSSIIEIQPGKLLQFSVPLDHLSGEKCIRVRYWIESARPPVSEAGYRFLWLGHSR